jgi:amino acid transporter
MVKDKASFTYTDINALVIRSVLIYTLCFAVLAVAYFFYKKRRYRNDEFRRVKPKQYLKSSIINYFGFGLLTLSIVYIVARFGIMDTSIVAYNPLDVYVIIFSVAGLIFLGVTIKNLVVAIKNNAERKRAIRLHLGNDVIDDGTGIK